MSNSHIPGRPAYPQHPDADSDTDLGMTIWDAAALAAIPGLCARQDQRGPFRLDQVAFEAANIADQFMAERRRRIERPIDFVDGE